MTCPRCFHAIGEHYLCLEHGGEVVWSDAAKRWKPRTIDYPPPEALLSFKHPWWDFLDQTDYSKLPASPMGQMRFREIVP